MVLVDTSVWIRFLAGREPYATELDSLLERDEVAGHELVFGELLIGDKGGLKICSMLTSRCTRQPWFRMEMSSPRTGAPSAWSRGRMD
jgi:hypothetical protein